MVPVLPLPFGPVLGELQAAMITEKCVLGGAEAREAFPTVENTSEMQLASPETRICTATSGLRGENLAKEGVHARPSLFVSRLSRDA